MTGRRREDETDPAAFEPGDFGKWQGTWYISTPSGYIGSLANHTIQEHEDGTISVKPSILVRQSPVREEWHGFLERGVWRVA